MSESIKTWKKLTDKAVIIGDREIPLRYTVHQMQELEKILVTGEGDSGLKRSLSEIAKQDLAICEIALNPEPNSICVTGAEIESQLDLDQIKLLAHYWMQNKVFSPQLVKN